MIQKWSSGASNTIIVRRLCRQYITWQRAEEDHRTLDIISGTFTALPFTFARLELINLQPARFIDIVL